MAGPGLGQPRGLSPPPQAPLARPRGLLQPRDRPRAQRADPRGSQTRQAQGPIYRECCVCSYVVKT